MNKTIKKIASEKFADTLGLDAVKRCKGNLCICWSEYKEKTIITFQLIDKMNSEQELIENENIEQEGALVISVEKRRNRAEIISDTMSKYLLR